MGVFDGSIVTPRAVPDPFTDHTLPPPGALDYSSITALTALAGTTGVDACLIQGDKWQQLVGNHTENVAIDHKLQITGNRSEQVTGNHQHTIVGTTNTTHVGVHNQTNVAPRNDTFNHVRTENHAEQEHQNQPTGRMESTNTEKTETKEEHHLKIDEWSVIQAKWEYTTFNLENKATNIAYNGISAEAKQFEHKSHLVETKLQAFATETVPAKLKAAGTHAKAILANLNAGLAGNTNSPTA